MTLSLARRVLLTYAAAVLAGCSSSSSSSAVPSAPGIAHVRYVDGAPFLKALENGTPQNLGVAYLQVNNQTVVSMFDYGTFSSFLPLNAGVHSLVARNQLGYSVGPLKTPSLSAGKNYSLVVVGSYPKYSVLAFEEPASSNDAQLSLYEASPATRRAGFGRFQASTNSNYKELGSAAFGDVATANLGKSVSDFGGFAGTASKRLGEVTPAQVDSFDAQNALPFKNASRLSLFLFDKQCDSSGSNCGSAVFGSLDR